ncbi:MAG: YnbE family lipoprotein [Alphaproteobacteria bacterium]|jgi:hypothetical protein|nr:YnbE family lipoprotein [Alphaproteobacteria bacterium]
MHKYSLALFGLSSLLIGCTPTIKVEAPDKPIVINMNMKIDHKVRVKVKNDLKRAKKENPEIFA